MFKRVTSLLMAIIMVISMLPAQALALETDTETGTEVSETTAATVEETTAPVIGTTESVTEAFEELPPETTIGEIVAETSAATEPTAAETATETGPEITVPETVPETEALEIVVEETEAEEASGGVVAEGACGDNLTWTLDEDGVLAISGSGDMWDYTHSERPSWLDYRTEIASVSLDDRITSIGSWAFCEFTDITDIELPAGITGIGAYAFAGCNALRTIEIPENVAFIGESAFEECVALAEIRFQGKAPTLEDEIFNEYVTATAYYPAYDPTWTDAARQAFGGDITWKPVLPSGTCGKNLSWALNENGVLTISGSGAMEDYTSAEETPWYDCREHITAVVIDGSAASIGANAFNGIAWLEAVTIYAPISAIGTNAFAGCDNAEVRYSGTANQWRLMGYKLDKTICSDGTLWDFGTCGSNLAYMIVDDSRAFLFVCAAAVVSLLELFAAEKRAVHPILPGGFMKRSPFILSVAALFLTQGLMQANMTNTIVFVNYTQPDSSAISGYAISVMYLGMSLGSVIIGPLADKFEPKHVLTGSLILTGLGCGILFLFTTATSPLLLMAALGILGFGLGGNGTIFMKVALSGLSQQEAGAGTGTYGLFRDLAAPFGVAVFVPLFTNQITGLVSGGTAPAEAAVLSIHTLAIAELLCIAAGIAAVCFLPKTRNK